MSRIIRYAALSLALLRASTQTPTPSFEVASIKLHAAVAPQTVNGRTKMQGPHMTFSGPTVRATGVDLGYLVAFAYDLKPYELSDKGLPNWKSAQFDIAANAEGRQPLTRDQFRPLFRSLLEERFKLKFHRETKEMSGYMLTIAKNGPKLKQSDPDTKPTLIMEATDCTEITVANWTMEQLIRQLSFPLGEPILDATGLAGGYDYKLTWSDHNSSCASLFTAIQEQLGLKLDHRKEPIQVFVVDSAVKPTLE